MAPYLILGIILLLAVLGPLLGADTRDGLDWWPLGRRTPRRSGPPARPLGC